MIIATSKNPSGATLDMSDANLFADSKPISGPHKPPSGKPNIPVPDELKDAKFNSLVRACPEGDVDQLRVFADFLAANEFANRANVTTPG